MAVEASGRLYATFALRIRALVLDSVFVSGVLVVVAITAGALHFGQTMRIGLFAVLIALVIFYEPVLVAFSGSTLGQRFCNLKVVAPTESGRLPLWKAFLRWLLKVVTGLASFATMGATRRNQALHDLPFGTTVQVAHVARARRYDFVSERAVEPGGSRPWWGRRLLVIAGYLLLALLLMAVAEGVLVSAECVEGRQCAAGETNSRANHLDGVARGQHCRLFVRLAGAVVWRSTSPNARGVSSECGDLSCSCGLVVFWGVSAQEAASRTGMDMKLFRSSTTKTSH